MVVKVVRFGSNSFFARTAVQNLCSATAGEIEHYNVLIEFNGLGPSFVDTLRCG